MTHPHQLQKLADSRSIKGVLVAASPQSGLHLGLEPPFLLAVGCVFCSFLKLSVIPALTDLCSCAVSYP